jgi:hypothetical protein
VLDPLAKASRMSDLYFQIPQMLTTSAIGMVIYVATAPFWEPLPWAS